MKFIFRTVIAAAVLLLYMFRNANSIKKKKHFIELESAHGFRPFRIIFIADIHRKKLPEDFISFPADAIIIGGDLTERGVPLSRTAENLRILAAAAPVYFIWGNNDREVGERNLRKLMNHYGIRILDNEVVELFGQPHLKLAGIDYFSEGDDKIERTFANVEKEDTVLFLSHTPSIFNYMRIKYNVAFQMAGHTHGGQIRIGRFGLYKKGALKRTDSGYELITNGYGTTTLPLRLGAEAQYHVIDISPKKRKISG